MISIDSSNWNFLYHKNALLWVVLAKP